MTGATVALFSAASRSTASLSGIEWPTLFFFIGLFVMVGALEETGRDRRGRRGHRLGHRRQPHVGAARHRVGLRDRLRARRQHPVHRRDDPRRRAAAGRLGGDDAYWWALALGACFGGNATLVAAAANVAAAGMAARAGRPIGFVRFLKIGVPVTLASMLIATAYIALRYL